MVNDTDHIAERFTPELNALRILINNMHEWTIHGLRMVNVDEVKEAHRTLFEGEGVFSFVQDGETRRNYSLDNPNDK